MSRKQGPRLAGMRPAANAAHRRREAAGNAMTAKEAAQ